MPDFLIDLCNNLTIDNYVLIIAATVFIVSVVITAYIKYKQMKNDKT